MISFFEHLQTIVIVANVSQQTPPHQGSFSFVFSSMKSKESLSIVSRTFDLEIKLQEIMFFLQFLKSLKFTSAGRGWRRISQIVWAVARPTNSRGPGNF